MGSRPNNRRSLPLRKKPAYKFLISACLVGRDCKYNGKNNINSKIRDLFKRGGCLAVCPEVIGGLPVPRPPAEIVGSKVINAAGRNVAKECRRGTAAVLRLTKKYGISRAILKSNSPCCGVGKIYDGTFTGSLESGNGILAAALIRSGIKVCSERNFST